MRTKNNIPQFDTFLIDKNVYHNNVRWWHEQITDICKTPKYNLTHYVNDVMFDANPIYNGWISEIKKAIRIIQHPLHSCDTEIGAWVDTFEIAKHNTVVNELVISMELNTTTFETAQKLIKQWLINNLSPDEMEQYIEKNIPQQSLLS